MKIIICLFLFILTSISSPVFATRDTLQKKIVPRVLMETTSLPTGTPVKLRLVHRFQKYNKDPFHKSDIYDLSIDSPKSVNFTPDGKKFYVHSLEGQRTSVYDTESMTLKKQILHQFNSTDKNLFKDGEHTIFNYTYRDHYTDFNIFGGKPVESCMSHNGKYLWVTYYRRDFDINAECPSALAIIDTETDSIVRVMPTGPLPKMIASSPDNKYIAVTHWGDNTVGIIDIGSSSFTDFHYIAHLIVDYRIVLEFGDEPVNRDQRCGHCLRGTVFTPDGKNLLVGKMGGSGGIAIFTVPQFEYLGTVTGQKSNIRHLIIHDEDIIISTNNTGFIQKTRWADLIATKSTSPGKTTAYDEWINCQTGSGVRTIATNSSGEYIFASVNNESKIAVVRRSDMKLICSVKADAYPVGLAVSPDDSKLIVTSQGKNDLGGNSVMIFEIKYFRWQDEMLLSKTLKGLFQGAAKICPI